MFVSFRFVFVLCVVLFWRCLVSVCSSRHVCPESSTGTEVGPTLARTWSARVWDGGGGCRDPFEPRAGSEVSALAPPFLGATGTRALSSEAGGRSVPHRACPARPLRGHRLLTAVPSPRAGARDWSPGTRRTLRGAAFVFSGFRLFQRLTRRN